MKERFRLLMFGLLFFNLVSRAQTPTQGKSVASGKVIYEQNCLSCHQADASGVPHTASSLIGSEYVNGDKTRLIKIILNGLQGVVIKGKSFGNPMPSFDSLSDQEIAALLTFVRANFSNTSGFVKVEEVTAARGGK